MTQKHATPEQLEAVLSVLTSAGPYLPDTQQEHRDQIYNGLYDLACKGVIPPEIKLEVQLGISEPGAWGFRFSDDFMDWLSAKTVHCPWCRKHCTVEWKGPLRYVHCGACGHWSTGPFDQVDEP